MLWFYHLSVTGPSKRSSRRETRWHSRTSNHSSPPSIIRRLLTHRSPDPYRPAETETVDRPNPCMTRPCSCPRRCGGGPPALRTWALRTCPPLLVRLGYNSKVCSNPKGWRWSSVLTYMTWQVKEGLMLIDRYYHFTFTKDRSRAWLVKADHKMYIAEH